MTYSGGAKGVDGRSMSAALEAGGRVVGVLADGLERAVRAPANREAIASGRLTLLTPYSPKAPFNVGAAMGRNKLIYTLADYALVVASDAESGGTWAVRDRSDQGRLGSRLRVRGNGLPGRQRSTPAPGAVPFPFPFTGRGEDLGDWLADKVRRRPVQPTLF